MFTVVQRDEHEGERRGEEREERSSTGAVNLVIS